MNHYEINDWKEFLEEQGCSAIVEYDDWIMCNCPFHDQTDVSRPSFGIHKDTGKGNCFGCGSKSWEDICRVFGISSEDFIDGMKSKAWDLFKNKFQKKKNYDMTYRRFYLPHGMDYLGHSHNSAAYKFKKYFYGKGIMNDDVIYDCSIGYVDLPSSRYHNCIIFPVEDCWGTLFFHARYIGTAKWKPRWFYPKGCAKWKTYFNWEKYKDRESLFFVEGATDAMKMMIFELPAVAAKEFSPHQLKMIFGSDIKNIFLLYDNDEGGRNYEDKACKLLGNSGINVKVCRLPKGVNDPAEINYSSDLFNENPFLSDYSDTLV